VSFDKVDFNQPYSTLDKPDTLLSLSSCLIKKLLSLQSWYGYMLHDAANDPVNTLNTWRRNEVAQCFSTNSSPPTAPLHLLKHPQVFIVVSR
jgi:hypothetical protein